jgi:hypothetical protein
MLFPPAAVSLRVATVKVMSSRLAASILAVAAVSGCGELVDANGGGSLDASTDGDRSDCTGRADADAGADSSETSETGFKSDADGSALHDALFCGGILPFVTEHADPVALLLRRRSTRSCSAPTKMANYPTSRTKPISALPGARLHFRRPANRQMTGERAPTPASLRSYTSPLRIPAFLDPLRQHDFSGRRLGRPDTCRTPNSWCGSPCAPATTKASQLFEQISLAGSSQRRHPSCRPWSPERPRTTASPQWTRSHTRDPA